MQSTRAPPKARTLYDHCDVLGDFGRGRERCGCRSDARKMENGVPADDLPINFDTPSLQAAFYTAIPRVSI